MADFTFKGKTYLIDWQGFLLDFKKWDENFAEGMAVSANISPGLTKEHWDIIHFIRDSFNKEGRCPIVYQTCRMNGLRLNDFKRLFPTGYLRGACKLAGITYKESFAKHPGLISSDEEAADIVLDKTDEIDICGFLMNPFEWDERFAIFRANEMKMPEGLTDQHWLIINFLRESYEKNNEVPTVYETCEANDIELEELERLFPDGYHRGAVKIAGLRVR